LYRWFQTPAGRRRSIPVVAVLSGSVIAGSVLLFGGRDTSNEPPTISEDTVVVTTGQPNDENSTTSDSADDVVGDPEYIDSIVQVMVIEDDMPCQSGSGTVVGDGTLVLTNFHVIEEGGDCRVDAIEIWTSESPSSDPRPTHDARVVVDDVIADLTILRVTSKGGVTAGLVPLELGDDPAVGEDLVIVGFPAIGGTSITISKGIVSGFTLDSGVRWIKTDATIAGGSSGGAALSGTRRLVGIPTMASQGANDEIVDCRQVADTNGDGETDDADACVPIGGFFNLLSPVSRARALIARVDS
jgi:S1-C subfamily serine protease